AASVSVADIGPPLLDRPSLRLRGFLGEARFGSIFFRGAAEATDLRTHEPPGIGYTSGGVVSPAHLELLEDVVNVVLHRRHLDVEPRGDFLVRQPLPDQADDLALARRQLGRSPGS